MSLKYSRKACMLASCLAVSACITDNPPSVIQSASLNGAPPTISGSVLDQCKSEEPFWDDAIISETAAFDPNLTLYLARLIYIRGGGDRVADLKIYSFDYNAANIFGVRNDGTVACLYVLEAGSLRYLDSLRLDERGEARISSPDALTGRVGRALSR